MHHDRLLNSGWTVRDVPWMTESDWNMMVKYLGEENMYICTVSSYKDDTGEIMVRGTIVVNPAVNEEVD